MRPEPPERKSGASASLGTSTTRRRLASRELFVPRPSPRSIDSRVSRSKEGPSSLERLICEEADRRGRSPTGRRASRGVSIFSSGDPEVKLGSRAPARVKRTRNLGGLISNEIILFELQQFLET